MTDKMTTKCRGCRGTGIDGLGFECGHCRGSGVDPWGAHPSPRPDPVVTNRIGIGMHESFGPTQPCFTCHSPRCWGCGPRPLDAFLGPDNIRRDPDPRMAADPARGEDGEAVRAAAKLREIRHDVGLATAGLLAGTPEAVRDIIRERDEARAERDRIREEATVYRDTLDEMTAERDEARAEVERLRGALIRAIEAIDRAEPNRHSPWCNEVHEGGACEGDYLMTSFMVDLRALAASTPEGDPQ